MSKKAHQKDIVSYRLTEEDAKWINFWYNNPGGVQGNVQIVRGNPVVAGERIPLLVVKVSGERVNGPVFPDGSAQLWVHDINEGNNNGEWSWGDKDDED